jgi:hypothetical protein
MLFRLGARTMFSLFRSKVFNLGFLTSILLLLFVSLLEIKIISASRTLCDHCKNVIGFPIGFYKYFGYAFSYQNGVIIWRLILNILVMLLLSFIAGVFFKFIESKLVGRKLK